VQIDPEVPEPPSPPLVLVIVLIAPLVGVVLRWASVSTLVTTTMALVLSAVCAGMLGVPALFWLLTRRASPRLFALMGLIIGAMPMLLTIASGMAGLTIRHGWHDMLEIVRKGAPLPWFGQILWSRFAEIVVWCALAGATSALVHWGLIVAEPRRRGIATAAISIVIAAAAVAGLSRP
jgi:hypothetical protein